MTTASESSRDTGPTQSDTTTCAPSKVLSDSATSSAAGSPVKTCRSLGEALGSKVHALVSGTSFRASFARFDPVSSSWRTSQQSVIPTVEAPKFSDALPKAGMMRSGSLFALPTLERLISESGCSSWGGAWATPRAAWNAGQQEEPGRQGRIKGGASLSVQVRQMWAAPSASLHNMSESPESFHTRREKLKQEHKNGNGAGTPLTVQVRQTWATPHAIYGDHPGMTDTEHLTEQVKSTRPTPAARDWKDTGTSPSEHERNMPGLAACAGGALNPDWVEQLMGFPHDWTRIPSQRAPTNPNTPAKPSASRRRKKAAP